MLVLVLTHPGNAFVPILRKVGAEVAVGDDPSAFTAEQIAQAEVIVNHRNRGRHVSSLLPSLKNLRWIHSLSAGVEDLLTPAIKASEIPLTNSRGVYSRSLAEWGLMAMLYFAKDVRRLVEQRKAGVWAQFECQMLRDARLAILGYGSIGREVARLGAAFGMNVTGIRRSAPSSAPDEHATIVPSTQTLMALTDADYVVSALPLTPETRHAVGNREFAAMKPESIFINIGRGATVQESALIHALDQRKIRGAALDVFEVEPLPGDSPLWRMENVLLSPHCADHTATWEHESAEFFVENFERFAKGEPLRNIVDKESGY
jgi:phosphoglycerate dehydrogenase-like enzyme